MKQITGVGMSQSAEAGFTITLLIDNRLETFNLEHLIVTALIIEAAQALRKSNELPCQTPL